MDFFLPPPRSSSLLQLTLPSFRPSPIRMDTNVAHITNLMTSLGTSSPPPNSHPPTATTTLPSHSRSTTLSTSSDRSTYASAPALIAATKKYVKAYMSTFDASHDYAHIKRVVALSKHILHSELQLQEEAQKQRAATSNGTTTPSSPTSSSSSSSRSPCRRNNPSESKVRIPSPKPPGRPTPYSPTLITLCALLHDVGDAKYASRIAPSQDPDTLAKDVLLSLNSEPALASTVQTIIKSVPYSHEVRNPERVRGVLLHHPELAIVQDADRLDALGAVGIGRAFTFGGARAGGASNASGVGGGGGGNAAEVPKTPQGMDETIQHFTAKLEKVKGLMKTETGRRMAEIRTEKLRVFRRWWEEECAVVGADDSEEEGEAGMEGGTEGEGWLEEE
ncbi:hypothetical protein MMC08_005734 [Hypocenomyce scalaris]|nr:hypothetical protein [Hypocenomyce scalaris]